MLLVTQLLNPEACSAFNDLAAPQPMPAHLILYAIRLLTS